VDARLAVGNNGETLVADSSTSTGLRYQATNAAGKNAVINGAMEVWQRGTSFSAVGYTADRWYTNTTNAITRSTTVPTGFNYSLNWVTAGAYPVVATYVELPVAGAKGNFTGNWVVSFYAKASTATTMASEAYWTDGSSRANAVSIASQGNSLTTSWTRFTMPVNFDSSSPVGTSKAIELTNYVATGGATINITGVQLEIGSVPTAFTRAGGTIQGELAACQRYFWVAGTGSGQLLGNGIYVSATQFNAPISFPVTMRSTPTLSSTTGTSYYDTYNGASNAFNSLTIFGAGVQSSGVYNSSASGTQYRSAYLETGNAASFVAFSAEL
jgi:hypothetical protein